MSGSSRPLIVLICRIPVPRYFLEDLTEVHRFEGRESRVSIAICANAIAQHHNRQPRVCTLTFLGAEEYLSQSMI